MRTESRMSTALLAALFLVLADFANECIERIIYAHAGLCRCLHEWYAILTSHLVCWCVERKRNSETKLRTQLEDLQNGLQRDAARTTISTYLSSGVHIDRPRLQVAFVTHQHHGHLFGVFDTFDLLSICSWNWNKLVLNK